MTSAPDRYQRLASLRFTGGGHPTEATARSLEEELFATPT